MLLNYKLIKMFKVQEKKINRIPYRIIKNEVKYKSLICLTVSNNLFWCELALKYSMNPYRKNGL